jgi:carbon starvation protein
MLATMVVLFAGTTMDSGVRLQRYIIQEWGLIYRIPAADQRHTGHAAGSGACLLLAFGAGGTSGGGGMIIWPLFGATNQILAGMTLLIISVMLIKLGRPSYYTLLPMLFVFTMSFLAACVTLMQFYRDGNYLLVALDLVVLGTSLMVMLEAGSVITAHRRGARGLGDSSTR